MKNVPFWIYYSLICIILLGIIIIPLYVYFSHFGSEYSQNIQDWGYFGDYLNGTMSPAIALCGLLVSSLIWIISERRAKSLIDIQKMEKRPFPYILCVDFEHLIEINLSNKGLGPLKIIEFTIKKNVNNAPPITYDSFFALVNDNLRDIIFNNYSDEQVGLVVGQGEKKNLIRLGVGGNYNNNNFVVPRNSLRNVLRDCEIVIKYTDVYEQDNFDYSKKLDWYNRHFNKID
jgi:hypothetical protein